MVVEKLEELMSVTNWDSRYPPSLSQVMCVVIAWKSIGKEYQMRADRSPARTRK